MALSRDSKHEEMPCLLFLTVSLHYRDNNNPTMSNKKILNIEGFSPTSKLPRSLISGTGCNQVSVNAQTAAFTSENVQNIQIFVVITVTNELHPKC